MAKPSNPELLAKFPVDTTVPDTHEVWQVTTKIIVPKGTNLEQFLADLSANRIDLPVPIEQMKFVYTDISKL